MVGALAIKAIRTCEKKKAFLYIEQQSNISNSESIDKFICSICAIIKHIESANITSTYPDVVIQVLILYILFQKPPPFPDRAVAQEIPPPRTNHSLNFFIFFYFELVYA